MIYESLLCFGQWSRSTLELEPMVLTRWRDQQEVEHAALHAHALEQCTGLLGPVFAAGDV